MYSEWSLGQQLNAAAPAPVGKIPLWSAVIWLAGTFGLFLIVGKADEVGNLDVLSLFVLGTLVLFIAGYMSQSSTRSVRALAEPSTQLINRMVKMGGVYYLLYGVAQMRQFDMLSASGLLESLRNPGAAYIAKFETFERQSALGITDPLMQILTLGAVASAPLIPLSVVYWKHLTHTSKLIGMLGLVSYASFFLGIGTLVGLGNLVIFGLAALMVSFGSRTGRNPYSRQNRNPDHRWRRTRVGNPKGKSRFAAALAIVSIIGFVSYMSYNQGARTTEVGNERDYDPNPVVQSVFGEQFARGFSVMIAYPTHGYQGLAYNLETPFEWSRFQGASRALDSYLAQYGLSESRYSTSYPARTEERTGWPAGQYWATIYPWVASDFTFVGAVLLMAVLGWWLSRWYRESLRGDVISLLLFSQLIFLIAYIPANNQIGLSRPNLICFVSLLVVYAITRGRVMRHPDSTRGDS